MSQDLVPFEAKLPAHLQALAQAVNADDLIAGAGGGFPVISIKGKVFHEVRAGERRLVTRPDSPEEPAASIEVVIIRANPAISKTYYTDGYTDGSEEKPTCYSNDGVAPALDAVAPQAAKCATCPHNAWGSKISENGSKIKACSDFRRLAIAPLGQLNDPMLLRVPAASLKSLREYGDVLKKRGVAYPVVSTRIGFDHSVAHPALTFKPVSFLNETQVATVTEVVQSDIVGQILGTGAAPQVNTPKASAPETDKAPAVAAPPPAPAPKAEAPKPAAKPKVEAPAPAKPKPAPKPVEVAVAGAGSLQDDLEKLLSAAGFDDK